MRESVRIMMDSPEYNRLATNWGAQGRYLDYDFSAAVRATMLEYAVSGECPFSEGGSCCNTEPAECPIYKRWQRGYTETNCGVSECSSRCGPLMIMRYGLKRKRTSEDIGGDA